MDNSVGVIGYFDGGTYDSGCAWEVGYAWALGMPGSLGNDRLSYMGSGEFFRVLPYK